MLQGIFSKKANEPTNWLEITNEAHLDDLHQSSFKEPVLVFKHSTRCAISSMALSRFERSYNAQGGFKPYLLDVIANRDISNRIAEKYQVPHESPQAILIHKGVAVYNESHTAILFEELSRKSREIV